MNDNIASIGTDKIMQEGQSQADRILYEVMCKLYAAILNSDSPMFTLDDGTNCHVKGFLEPVERHNNKDEPQTEPRYAFDIKLDKGPIDHLEFLVKCSGWGRELNVPKTERPTDG